MLPNNPYVLLSTINTYLRDKYDSLEELVNDLDEDLNKITNTLESIGYYYNKERNQFLSEV